MTATAQQYVTLLQQLLPPGDAITREDDANITQLLLGVAEEFARVENRGLDLVEERDPRTATETLADWERSLGLPDCSAPTSLAGRRAAVTARDIGVLAQNDAFYIAFVNALGFSGTRIVRRPYRPFVAGSRSGARLWNMGVRHGASLNALTVGSGWPNVWIIDVIEPGQDAPPTDELDLILECQVAQIALTRFLAHHLYRLFASNGAGVTVDHNAALDLFHPETAEALPTIAIDALPTITLHGVEYLWIEDDGANPVDIERSTVPTQMVAHGWRVHVIPSFGSDDTDSHTVYTFGDSSVSRLELVPYSATQMVFRLWQTRTAQSVTGYCLVAESLPLTFRSSDKLSVDLDGQTGALIVHGARSGGGEVGEGFLWTLRDTGALHIGKDS